MRLRFSSLLVVFLFFFIGGALVPEGRAEVTNNLLLSVFIFTAVITVKESNMLMIPAFFVAVLAIGLNSVAIVDRSNSAELAFLIVSTFFFAVLTYRLFWQVFVVESFDKDLIFGAICVYIFLGVLWGLLYSIIYFFDPDSFLSVKEVGLTVHHFLYFSFVTQTTLGYGDITPITTIAKNLAAVQAITGVFYLATLMAGLVGKFKVKG